MILRPVCIVVVAYHAPEALRRCLASVGNQRQVTVIDNSSSTAVALTAGQHRATYIDARSNRGFAGGVNLGIAELSLMEVDILLLNPDAIIDDKMITELQQFLHRADNARIAAVAPQLVRTDGVSERVSWPYPSPWRMCAEAVGLGHLPARRRFVVGAVLLLRGEAVCDVGSFDERFFLYGEEADWQRRAFRRGWRSSVCPSALAQHGGAGTSPDALRREVLFHAGQEIYVRKWYGTAGWCLYRVAALVGAIARALVLTHARRTAAARRALLYLRGPVRSATER